MSDMSWLLTLYWTYYELSARYRALTSCADPALYRAECACIAAQAHGYLCAGPPPDLAAGFARLAAATDMRWNMEPRAHH